MSEGDEKAFRFFFDKYYSDLCNFVNQYINNPEMAEELVQDIFVYLWEKKSDISLHTSVKAYLFLASKNKCLNYLRNTKSKIRLLEKYQNENKAVQSTSDLFLESEELKEILDKSINSLPNRCREIFLLSRQSELSHKEIADKLNISPKSVENQIGIALKKLRNGLRPYYDRIFVLFLFFISN
jgi:RNA polymerase sigma-70 factor (ECF subfamily)